MGELLWTEDADESMNRLEADPMSHHVLMAVRRTLGRLEADHNDPRLGTRTFSTENYGHVRATPVRIEDWYVFWRPVHDTGDVLIIDLGPLLF
jgi:hypothetical protein